MILGIDIGSMAVSAVLLNAEKQITGTFYEAHLGQIGRCLEKMAGQLDPQARAAISLPSSNLISN